MSSSLKRLIFVLLTLPLLLLLVAAGYMLGMDLLEGSPRSFQRSVEWAAETLTTTGYGSESSWSHPLMVFFVVTIQFIGALLVFFVVPIALVPFLEQRFEVKLPRKAPPLEDHVVIFHYGSAVATLLTELEKNDVEVLVVETNREVARRLHDDGHRVLLAQDAENALEVAQIGSARALLANGTDDQNAALIVGARQADFEGEVIALVEEPVHRRPMRVAGASAVFTPRHVLGTALAARASERISPTVAGIQQLGRKLRTFEVRVEVGSSLAGRTLAEVGIGRETGATVLGQWVGGRLHAPLTGDDRIEAGAILVLAGSEASIERMEEACAGTRRREGQGPFLVGGYGEVGRKVVELLRDAAEEVVVIDRQPGPGVDLVANILDAEVFEGLDLLHSKGVILALDSDTATLFATLIVDDIAPDVPVTVRVNEASNVEKIHRAGADFALSLSQVASQILSRRLLGQEAIRFDAELRLLRASSERLAGRSTAELQVRQRTGCSVVAVERGDELIAGVGADFRFEEGDDVFVCGTEAEIGKFRHRFGD